MVPRMVAWTFAELEREVAEMRADICTSELDRLKRKIAVVRRVVEENDDVPAERMAWLKTFLKD